MKGHGRTLFTPKNLMQVIIGLGTLFAVSVIWVQLGLNEARTVVVIPDPTATGTTLTSSVQSTSTSPVIIEQATSTTTEISLPTPTKQVVATQTPSPTVRHTATVTALPATQTPTPPPANASKLVIPSIGVDAQIEIVGIDANGDMESPQDPTKVGLYDFSVYPGEVGRIVFSGHVDDAVIGKAVFWELRDIREGHSIEVHTDDGGIVIYRVTGIQRISANDDARPLIFSPTSSPTIVLITCDGSFDTTVGEYDERLIVIGELITGSN